MIQTHVKRQIQKTFIDFRSDTVTVPSPQMIQAMSKAVVGDDVYGEDVTVNLLQAEISELSGKESALFLVSGTMSNQIAIQSHLSHPPYSVVCDYKSHVYCHEASGISFHTGAMVLPCHTTALEIEKVLVTDDDVHHAPTKLLCLENTLNGTILPFEELKKISQLAKKHKIPIHLDGARLWNASAATGISIKEYAQYVDSISLCFSKGLGCPIGSVLVGSLGFIKRATHLRKLYGGGWRQAGYLASACKYSMENILPNLHRDHEIAQTLKNGLQKLGYSLLYPVETNMVWIDGSHLSCKDIVQHFRSRGIIVSAPDEKTGAWRLVIHHQISEENVLKFLDCLEEITEKENM